VPDVRPPSNLRVNGIDLTESLEDDIIVLFQRHSMFFDMNMMYVIWLFSIHHVLGK
jgi:hypothetical protein